VIHKNIRYYYTSTPKNNFNPSPQKKPITAIVMDIRTISKKHFQKLYPLAVVI